MEQKRPGRYISGASGLPVERPGPGGKGLEAAEKRRLQKEKRKTGLTYQIWFDRSHYNYIDLRKSAMEMWRWAFSCIIKQGDDYLYSFRIVPTTGGSFFRMLTEDLRLNTGLLDTSFCL